MSTANQPGDPGEPEIVEGEVVEGDVVDEAAEAAETVGLDEPVAVDTAAAEEATEGEADELRAALEERTVDLQRLQAEYVNYKRRVDRDRDAVRQSGAERVLGDLLPVLDAIDAAAGHEQLTGGFKGVAEQVQQVAARHGLVRYGEKGDAFDPQIHEALMHAPASEDLTGPTCVEVLQPGYRLGERIVRPARVAVADPS